MVDLAPEQLLDLKKVMQKSIIKYTDMNAENSSEAMDLVVSNVDKFVGNPEAASRAIVEAMNKKFGDAWNCVVGEGFNFEVSYMTKHMMYIFYNTNAILLFKY